MWYPFFAIKLQAWEIKKDAECGWLQWVQAPLVKVFTRWAYCGPQMDALVAVPAVLPKHTAPAK